MRWLKVLMVMVLFIAACGDDDSASSIESGTLFTGEDSVMAALADGCEAGDFIMCDVLFFAAPFDSSIETFADTCGGRNDGGPYCAEAFDVDIDIGALTEQCASDVMLACDQLFMYAADGSFEEDLGQSCNGAGRASRTCVVDHGLVWP